MGDAKILTKFNKSKTEKLVAIVRDQHLGATEVANDELSDEIFYFSFDNIIERFSFYPLHKIFDGKKQKFSLIRCLLIAVTSIKNKNLI